MSCVLCVNVLQSWSHLWCSLMVCTSLYYLTWLVLCFITHCLAEMLLWFIKSTLFEFHRPLERIFSCFLTWIVCCVLNLAKQTYYFCFGYQQNEWQKEKAEPRNLGGKKEKGKGKKKKEESLGNPAAQDCLGLMLNNWENTEISSGKRAGSFEAELYLWPGNKLLLHEKKDIAIGVEKNLDSSDVLVWQFWELPCANPVKLKAGTEE